MVYVANSILIVVYHAVLNFIPRLSKQKRNKIFLILCSVQIVVIVGMRNFNVGTDTMHFFKMFQRILSYKSLRDYELSLIEPLYAILNYTIGKLTGSYLIFNVVISALTVLFFSIAIYKLSNNVFWSIYLFVSCCFFYQMMNQFRQVLAMSITLYAFTFLVAEKNKKYIIWIVVAALIHKSALIMLILIPFSKRKYSKKMVAQYIFLTGVALLFSDLMVEIIKITPYRVYLGSSFDKHFELSAVLNLIVRICMFIFVTFFYLIYKKREDKYNIDLLYHFITWNLVLQILTVRFMLIGRVTSYFFYGYFLLIPNILETCFEKNFNKNLVKGSLFVLFLIYHITYFTYTKELYGISDYTSIFF